MSTVQVATLTVIVAMLPGLMYGQTQPTARAKTVRVSGVITDSRGAPMVNKPLEFRNVTVVSQTRSADLSTSTLTTRSDGGFVCTIRANDEYFLFLIDPDDPDPADPLYLNVGQIVVTVGQDIDLGKVVLTSKTKEARGGALIGPVTVTPLAGSKPPSAVLVTAIVVGADGPCIVHHDGNVVRLQNEKEQVGNSLVQISGDRRAVGWLADFPFCCASYPLAHALVVYRPGKPLRRFVGDGRAIFKWYFVSGGKQVVFNQSFPHGDLMDHYELRDVETGRRIGQWDGDLTVKAPKWTSGMRP